MFVILCSLLVTGFSINTAYASDYDYSAGIDCLPEPLPPQYNGGLVGNPSFDLGLDQWNVFGGGRITPRTTSTGNNFLVAYNRDKPFDSFSFWFDMKKDLVYTLSAWLQVDRGSEYVAAFYTGVDNRSVEIGSVIAKSGCWSMLKGGFTADENIKADIHFATNNTDAELWVDNVSLKPFTREEWEAQQNKSIDRVRKRTIKIHVTTRTGQKIQGAQIAVNQTRPHFLIGSGAADTILTHKPYQDYFTSRFTAATPHNEMKWYYTEKMPGVENYTTADAMVSFFKKHRIAIRGHNILWADPHMILCWVKQLTPKNLLRAAVRRVGSVVSRYSDDVIGWDVMNENLHFSFYEERLGRNASAMFYQLVHAMNVNTPLFLNEYNTLELPTDPYSIPHKVAAKVRETRAFPGNEELVVRVGLEGHFIRKPMVAHIRAALDIIGATKMPIWITELDTKRGPLQASQLEEVMREAFSHPSVEGMIVWGGWKPSGCNETCLADKNYDILPKGCAQMCLVDNNFNNLPAGNVVDKLLKEWRTNVRGWTDEHGVFEHKVFLGEHLLTLTHPLIPRPVTVTFNVTAGDGPLDLRVRV